MSFHAKYTSEKRKEKDDSVEKVESKKIILSEDAFAIGEQIELLINTWRNK